MKKRNVLIALLILAMMVVLIGCGSGSDADQPAAPDSNGEADLVEDNGTSAPAGNVDGFETAVGETVSNEAGDFTLVARASGIPTQTTGPMILNISQVNTAIGMISDDYIDFFEAEEIHYIQIDMEVENTSEDTINFYAGQATITTNTGEQLESDMWLSDHIDGEYIGAVRKSGSQFFILQSSRAEDVEWVRILISSPIDDDWDSVGEDLDFRVEF